MITRDTDSGLEWLDLTVTAGRSYSDISGKLGAEQEFSGWQYATAIQVGGFLDAFGGDSNYYSGWSTQNNGLFDSVAPLWGDLYSSRYSFISVGDGYSGAILKPANVEGNVTTYAYLNDWYKDSLAKSMDYIYTDYDISMTLTSPDIGSALTRDVSAVPIPAAVWLFCTGLVGMFGMTRKKRSLAA